MLITSARVDPVTSGPVPAVNGPSSARNCRPATRVWLATAKSRRAKKPAPANPAGYSSSRQSLQRMTVPGGYSKSVSPHKRNPAFRQIALDAG
jgi:hypothetical protein